MRYNHNTTSVFALVGAVLFIFSCAPVVDYTDVIVIANEHFMMDFAKGDAAGVAALYSEDAQLLPTNSEIITGHEAIQELWQGAMDMGVKTAMLETVEVEGMGRLAYELGKYKLYADDDLVLDQGKYIVIWKRTDSQWRMYRDIWNTSILLPE